MTKEQIINRLKKIIAKAKRYESCSMDGDAQCYDYLMTDIEEILKLEMYKEEKRSNWKNV